ncbi:site-specific integrase [Actinoplanes sp. KI2]|uniref:tyrosine-type recombinase/integrase n=1 Tax=Actinoplanes sp. KI2 TaxID=2983315 RepID=UPI0021D56BF8|nr:site-specific integrase [Actinoplanes sp. KI2]MCU7730715.1 site-specific integrase [Actinoplanes sp. KI2]
MALYHLDKLCAGLNETDWGGLIRDWDRSLRAANHPETTRYNYLIAVVQLARYLRSEESEYAGSAAALGPAAVKKRHLEAFQGWMLETRKATTALNKHKALQQFFKWLIGEEEIESSPMERVPQPRTEEKLVPVMRDWETKKLLDHVRLKKDFAALRDEAIIRLFYNTGSRLSEIGNLMLTDLDMPSQSILLHGKGAKDRRVRFGTKTAKALSLYLRARAKRRYAGEIEQLWMAERGKVALTPNGIKLMLKRHGKRAGLGHVYAHRWRHNFAHEWKRAGGNTGDLMLLLGWSSDAMPRRYGRSAAAERAQEIQTQLGIGEKV